MEQPNYVLKANEGVLVPKNENIPFGLSFLSGHKMVPSPFEIRFYDDYLVVYREKHYYSKKHYKKEYNKFYYNDIRLLRYRKVSEKINIIGKGEFIWYDYNNDGSLPEKPSFHKISDGITWFYTSKDKNVDFIGEIEKHSSIKFEIHDS